MGKVKSKKQVLANLMSKDTMRAVWQRFVMMFGMDYRSLAAYRFTMGCCVMGDIVERMGDLYTIYTENGLFPRHLIVTKYSSNYFVPIHLANTSWWAQLCFFLIHFFFAFNMAIGNRTKLYSFLTWAMTVSLQAYVGLVGHGGDVYFRILLFFTIFLPTAECFSVDKWTFANNSSTMARDEEQSPLVEVTTVDEAKSESDARANGAPKVRESYAESLNKHRFISFATILVLLQMSCMYVASYFHKYGEEWKNGEATFYAISLDYFQTPFARMLLPWRTTLKLMTLAVAKWEFIGAFCWYMPFYTDYLRILGAVGFMALHAGFVSCLRLGLFFWVCFCAQTINLSPVFWEYTFGFFERRLMKGARPLRVFYNTSSPLSQYTTLIMKTFFILPTCAIYAPMDKIQEEPAMAMSMSTINTTPFGSDDEQSKRRRIGDDWFVTIDGNGIRRKNLAALNHLASKSPLLFAFAWLFSKVPEVVCSVAGKIVNLIHIKTQESQACTRRPSVYIRRRHHRRPSHRIFSVYNNTVCLIMCYLVLGFNLNIFHHTIPGWGFKWTQLAFLLRFDQGWNMFSPAPPKVHWWHAIHGVLDDGTRVELFKDNAFHDLLTNINYKVDFEKPVPFDTTYGNHRWFKFWENGYNQFGSEGLRLETGRYICRQFNSVNFGDKMLHSFTVYFVHEFMNLDGTVTAPQHQSLWNHICYEKK
ncbi:hypothetical protein SAMD00019534_059590 [Acytostelium subglobosum LB1]|uniref:hypothetical protein n=1 Tax=Acytostelium subglobosum LB1 TaxID=1410327 RepID=UPI000644E476|nr:hypothetical protein SAMD00019534_059590 [Acytostelium subglobosum LB1]GAM22784.1 hypothetical protein SAMD00019534_059590 [Acytostelium subglobosum LB1]|eukprot:XP_012754011.1 hypothetical protein SAMD00019534_059590 [Acytostelium subglobosum LB1]